MTNLKGDLKADLGQRLARVQALMREQGVGGLVVYSSGQHNMLRMDQLFYLTDFRCIGPSALLVPSSGATKLIVTPPWEGDRAREAAGVSDVKAARAEDRSFLIAYLPHGQPVGIDMTKMSGKKIVAHWYGPRVGTWQEIGSFASSGTREFFPPSVGDRTDWVLVLDDAGKGYPIEK